MKKEHILVGVDPGKENFSLAFYHTHTRIYTNFFTGNPDQTTSRLFAYMLDHPQYEYRVIVEDPNLDSALFYGWSTISGLIKAYKFCQGNVQLSDIESVYRTQAKKSERVGFVKLITQQFLHQLDAHEIRYIRIAPSQRTCVKLQDSKRLKGIKLLQAKMPTKTNRAEFKLLTKHTGQTNEHQRDAATLVFDRTFKWFEMKQRMQFTSG